MLNLPEAIASACAPLFETLPLEQAMPRLVGSAPRHAALVETLLQNPALAGRDDLAAGLWLYVDDLERSHAISQNIQGPTGAYWHGIMHRREGDFGNSHYWMRLAARHPLRQSAPDLDPDGLIDRVAQARGENPADLLDWQRREWAALFSSCAAE